jgi:hypothetical protein
LKDRNPFTLRVVQQAAYARRQSSPGGGEYLTSSHGRFTQYPLNRMVGGPQRGFGNLYSTETSLAPTGIPASNCPSRSTAQYLYRQRYVDCRNVELLRLKRTTSKANKNFCFLFTNKNHLHRRGTTVGMETILFEIRFRPGLYATSICSLLVTFRDIGSIFRVRRWGR